MKDIMTITKELEQEAEQISSFRSEIKAYLTRFGACYDKFTVTENDTFLGYVSETAISDYLLNLYGEKIEIKRWADEFNMNRIAHFVEENDSDGKDEM